MMFRRGILAIAALSVTTFAAPAIAQDKNPWDGFYVGAEGGFNRTKLPNGLPGVTDRKDIGIYYGGIVGWRTQLDSNLILGVEGHFGDSTAKFSGTTPVGLDTVDFSIKSGRQWGFDAIIGTAISEDTMIFASGGYVNGRFKVSAAAGGIGPLAVAGTDGGYRVGGGAEFRITENLNFRLTGHYQDVGNTDDMQLRAGIILPF